MDMPTIASGRQDVQIVRIEAAEGARVEKTTDRRGKPCWCIHVVWVLADGRRVLNTELHGLKRDAAADLASLPKTPKNPTFAMMNGEACIGRSVRYSLRGAP